MTRAFVQAIEPFVGLNGLGGKELSLALVANEVKRTFQDLKSAHEHIQIHAVDGFGFQNNVPAQHFGHGLW